MIPTYYGFPGQKEATPNDKTSGPCLFLHTLSMPFINVALKIRQYHVGEYVSLRAWLLGQITTVTVKTESSLKQRGDVYFFQIEQSIFKASNRWVQPNKYKTARLFFGKMRFR